VSFQGKYQILQTLSDGEVRCFRAQQISSGRSVLLHQLWPERNPPHQPDLASLLTEFLRNAEAETSGHILEIGEDSNRGFVVTEDLPECLDLRTWLQSATGVQEKPVESGLHQAYAEPARVTDGSAPVPADITQGNGVDESGDFTQWFQKTPPVIEPLTSSLNEDEIAPPLRPSPVAPAAPPTSQPHPGEFTMMFLAKGNALPQPSSPISPLAPAMPPMGEIPPGEFTGRFRAGSNAPPQPSFAASPEAPAVPPTGETLPGEFTGRFRAGSNAPAQPSFAASPEAPAAPPMGEIPPGEFTGRFRAGSNAPPQPSSPVSPPHPEENLTSAGQPRPTISRGQPPSGFEVVFRSRKTRPTVVPPSEPSGAAAPTTGKATSGPSEFTMMFARAGKGDMEPGVASAGPAPLGDGLPTMPSPGLTEEPQPSLTTPELVPPPPPPRSAGSPGETGVFERLFINREGTEAPPYGPKVPIVGSEAPPLTSADASRGPGEFTRLFNAQREPSTRVSSPDATQGSVGSRLPPSPPRAATPPEIPLRESADREGPGSFTQFFERRGEGGRGEAPILPPNPPPTFAPGPSRSAQKEPGAVTRILQSYRPPQADSAEQVLPVASPANEPSIEPDRRGGGEFPAAFHDSSPEAASVPPAPVSPPFVEPAPPPPKPAGPGAYTLIMQSPRRSAVVPPPSGPQAAPPGGVRPPVLPLAAPPMPVAPPLPQAPAPPPPAYRVPPVQFQQPAPPAFPPASAPGIPYPQIKAPPPPGIPKASLPAGSQKRVFWVSLIVLGCLFIMAVVVVIYFAIRH